MILANTATLRLHVWDLNDIGESPQSCDNEIRPSNFINRIWIPQTVGDQVWVWYEFRSPDERDVFYEFLPEKYTKIKGFVADNFTQADLDYWTR